ncbi:MAG: hypothetical protein A3G34_02300 [Candidatus Lindowbacteria bacterium RIFCSPLOWO2_12_FULL_62_27]|nr:MAG: hypothetical protein A3G34_02300 [Candidatus Lindowbacteria bacterium RIFCSPLOWO2_12_FULL_62_27]OGH61203.1 MAG: hypothetical protein A3I06_15490 [Candidatus Lindowbacteria bacterium RIFCSPLOWO2_02_FULL_62_12]
MWVLTGVGFVILVSVLLLDRRIRARPGRPGDRRLAGGLLAVSMAALAVSAVWQPQTLVGLLLALAAANAFIAWQRAGSFLEAARLKGDSVPAVGAEAPYEQFVNTFLSYLDRGQADTLEFEFRQWRMEIRFKNGAHVLPVTDTPFHLLLHIKRMFDAATVRNLKTGESKMRYVARGVMYEFSSEDAGGTLLRLRLLNKRPATPEETAAFERLKMKI